MQKSEIAEIDRPAPQKLEKPARRREELGREQLVTYTDESGGNSGGDPPAEPPPHIT